MAWPACAIIPARLHDQRVCLPPLFCVLCVLCRTPREAVTLWHPLTAWRGPQLALRRRARRIPLPHIANDFRTCLRCAQRQPNHSVLRPASAHFRLRLPPLRNDAHCCPTQARAALPAPTVIWVATTVIWVGRCGEPRVASVSGTPIPALRASTQHHAGCNVLHCN
jgi:hypothetical protein